MRDAGLAALRLILRGTFDRHPDLQVVLGHWGEMLLFWIDRADSLSNVAKHLERRVSDYIRTNFHITSSWMLQERLLRHTLDFIDIDRVMFSTDYPFHRPDAYSIERFLGSLPSTWEGAKLASGNAEPLFHLTAPGTVMRGPVETPALCSAPPASAASSGTRAREPGSERRGWISRR